MTLSTAQKSIVTPWTRFYWFIYHSNNSPNSNWSWRHKMSCSTSGMSIWNYFFRRRKLCYKVQLTPVIVLSTITMDFKKFWSDNIQRIITRLLCFVAYYVIKENLSEMMKSFIFCNKNSTKGCGTLTYNYHLQSNPTNAFNSMAGTYLQFNTLLR